jgi:hypothetical protein
MEDEMYTKMLLAAAAALTIASVPAFGQTAECPPDGSGNAVTCDNDDNTDDTTGTTDDTSQAPADQQNQGDNVLNNSQSGEGVTNTLDGEAFGNQGTKGGGNGNGGGGGGGNNNNNNN